MEMGSIVPFEAYSIPTTIVFDANGNIVARIVGMINADPVRALLQSLIA
jgi:thioredoxin-like negative regulator of GroEL